MLYKSNPEHEHGGEGASNVVEVQGQFAVVGGARGGLRVQGAGGGGGGGGGRVEVHLGGLRTQKQGHEPHGHGRTCQVGHHARVWKGNTTNYQTENPTKEDLTQEITFFFPTPHFQRRKKEKHKRLYLAIFY